MQKLLYALNRESSLRPRMCTESRSLVEDKNCIFFRIAANFLSPRESFCSYNFIQDVFIAIDDRSERWRRKIKEILFVYDWAGIVSGNNDVATMQLFLWWITKCLYNFKQRMRNDRVARKLRCFCPNIFYYISINSYCNFLAYLIFLLIKNHAIMLNMKGSCCSLNVFIQKVHANCLGIFWAKVTKLVLFFHL